MGRLNVDDNFIINRSGNNYQDPFSDVREYFGSFLPGSVCLFFQPTAPYDWVQKTDAKYNQATIRVVTGNGAGSGGSKNFSDVFKTWDAPVPTHGHGLGGGTHTHSASFSHGHGVTDPKHTHITRNAMGMHSHDLRGPAGTGSAGNPSAGVGSGNNWSVWDGYNTNPRSCTSDSAGGGGASSVTASGTGISVSNAKATITISAAKLNISSTSGTTGTVGTTMDFNIKYDKSIVCVKS